MPHVGLEPFSAAKAYHRIHDMLPVGPASPSLAAQLYELAANMPGIRQSPEPARIGDFTGVAMSHLGRLHGGALVFGDDGLVGGRSGTERRR